MLLYTSKNNITLELSAPQMAARVNSDIGTAFFILGKGMDGDLVSIGISDVFIKKYIIFLDFIKFLKKS
jgi:hypothetical protein